MSERTIDNHDENEEIVKEEAVTETTETPAEETPAEEHLLDIPEDEIWTYKIDGLQAPHINKPFEKATMKKVLTIVILVVAIGLSIYFSVRAVHTTEYDYDITDTYCELTKYSNPGNVTVLTIDKANDENETPVTRLREYAFNCDSMLEEVYIGPSVEEIDGKTFYSCWSLKGIFVDESNPYFCDVDGVLYTKDMKTVICCPPNNNVYRADKYVTPLNFPEDGSITYDEFNWAVSALDDALRNGSDFSEFENTTDGNIRKLTTLTGVTDYREFIEKYNAYAGHYVVPSTVETITDLAFAYCDFTAVYLPEGLKTIGTLAFFKSAYLADIYSYTSAEEVTSSTLMTADEGNLNTYISLPEGLEYIGSDSFSYLGKLHYMYIPASVTYVGHHAFWDTAGKQDGVVTGVSVMNVGADEHTFTSTVHRGDDWRPKYKNGLFKKTVDTVYSAERITEY